MADTMERTCRQCEMLESEAADNCMDIDGRMVAHNWDDPRDAEIEQLRSKLADAVERYQKFSDNLTGPRDAEIERLQRDNVIYRACANGYAESALRALMDMTGSYNKDNPWLGVTAAVALLMPGKTR